MLQKAFEEMDSHAQKASKEGKILFNKEHCYTLLDPYLRGKGIHGEASVHGEVPWRAQLFKDSTHHRPSPNEMLIPDEYLRKWQATFLIRHPALSIPSFYRAHSDVGQELNVNKLLLRTKLTISLRNIRLLYDWYKQDREAPNPIVLDANDIVHRPEAIHRYCDIVGLDPTNLQFSWTPHGTKDVESRPMPFKGVFLRTLQESSGVMGNKAPLTICTKQESKQWQAEFGEEVAQGLLKLVEESMPDYEYLKGERLMV